ncbi:MAG: hypothetical protein AAF985_08515 [Bacteroidota bacterium]
MSLLTLVVPLLPIIYEDFRYRAIHWFWIALLSMLLCLVYPINWHFTLINMGLLCIQMCGLTAYFSWKNKQLTNIVNRYIGLGDLVFFLPTCALFAPFAFLMYFIIGCSFSLLCFLLYRQWNQSVQNSIPLAGGMAMVLIAFVLLDLLAIVKMKDDLFYFQIFFST